MHKFLVFLFLTSMCLLTESRIVKRDAPPPTKEHGDTELHLKRFSDTIEPQFKVVFDQMTESLEPQFKDIFEQMTNNFEPQFKAIFEQMTDNLDLEFKAVYEQMRDNIVPQFQNIFEQMSESLGLQFKAVYEQMEDNIVPQFEAIFEQIAKNTPLELKPYFGPDNIPNFMTRDPTFYYEYVERCLEELSDNFESEFRDIFEQTAKEGTLEMGLMGPDFEPDTSTDFLSDAFVRRDAPGPAAPNTLESFQKHMEQFKSCIDQTLAKTVDEVNVKQVQPVFEVLGDHLNRLSKAFEDLTATKATGF